MKMNLEAKSDDDLASFLLLNKKWRKLKWLIKQKHFWLVPPILHTM